MGKKIKIIIKSIRFDESQIKQLEKEAQAEGREVAAWIRHLALTNPQRDKYKK